MPSGGWQGEEEQEKEKENVQWAHFGGWWANKEMEMGMGIASCCVTNQSKCSTMVTTICVQHLHVL